MRKSIKRLLALGLAATMAIGMATMASAATLTIQEAAIGETYTAYQILEKDDYGYYITAAQKASYGSEFAALFTISAENDGKYYVVPKNDDDPAIITWAKANTAKFGQKKAEVKATEKPATMEVDDGYYYVTTTSGSVVSIDDADAVIKEKNPGTPDVPDDFKTVGDNTIELGETANYTVTFNAVNNVVTYNETTGANSAELVTYYTVKDTSDAISIQTNTIRVKVGNRDAYTPAASDITYENNVLTVNIPWVDENDQPLYNKLETVVVTYDATVIATGEAVNEAEVSYNGKPFGKDDEKVYNATLKVIKVADGSKAPLAGAEFVLSKTVEDAEVYYKTATNDVEWVDSIDDATVFTSGADGKLSIVGLANGTYTLTETVAPEGYNLANPREITVEDKDVIDDTIEEVEVIDTVGTVLPSTGGVGTTLFYVVGCILVLGAGVVLVAKKRTQNI